MSENYANNFLSSDCLIETLHRVPLTGWLEISHVICIQYNSDIGDSSPIQKIGMSTPLPN